MDAGFALFIVTNQSGIGRGYYTEADMHAVNARLSEMLAPDGVRFEKIYFAPESPEAESPGRKPSPDVQCGWNAGVKQSILVRTGYGAEHERDHPETERAIVVDGLPEAVDWIIGDA